jgi:two-component system, LuxR family, response regulator FixJ
LRVLDEQVRKGGAKVFVVRRLQALELPLCEFEPYQKRRLHLVLFTIRRGRSGNRRHSKRMTHQNELSSNGLIVIVIGGDLAVRHALKFWLEVEGLTVRSYATGAELLVAGELARCDCLVVDQKIPETSGLQLIAQLRDRNFSAPAILVTSQPSLSQRKQADKAGVPIMEKPLLGNGLLDTIRGAIGSRLG